MRRTAGQQLARSLAYIRKEGPLLMRACRCVSERRSRASAEVIGQYQSQPRDNHSPAMRLADACVRACLVCVRVCERERFYACVIVAKLIIPLVAVGRIPSNLAIFREGEREIEFAWDLPRSTDFCEENANARDQVRRAGNSVSIRTGDLIDYWWLRSGAVAFACHWLQLSDKGCRLLAI